MYIWHYVKKGVNVFQLNKIITDSISSPKTTVRLIFATIALGMGCDLQHIKRVYHAGVPSSLEGI